MSFIVFHARQRVAAAAPLRAAHPHHPSTSAATPAQHPRPRWPGVRLHPIATAGLILLTGAWPSAQAQSQTPATTTATVVITGNPLGRDEALQPVTVLGGDALALRRAGTLGDTLAGLPGVAATGFGPQSSRPVIRGLDADRIRLLDNGGAAADASNLSFDHAVAIDPLVIERIEVLRGPAALLYGGSAIGGVVNTLDNRIPRAPLQGLFGRGELRLGGAANERAGAALVEGGAGALSWHADVASRRSDDLRVPRFQPPADEDGPARSATRVENSAGQRSAGALGASLASADGFIGAALDAYRNDYGVTVEPDVTIRMRREQLQLAGERRALAGPFSQLEFRYGETRYRHAEVEGSGEVGTTFRSSGRDLRLQARQAAWATPLGTLHGVLGLQWETLDFSALGEEAFVPATRSRHQALFTLQELQAGPVALSAGARIERSRISSDGDAADADEARFGAATERRFSPRSTSLAARWPFASGWQLSASAGRSERAPTYYELFANGLHVATGTYERGDDSLRAERSRQAELGLQWKQGPHAVRASLYQTRFDNYIALDASGTMITLPGEHGESEQSVPEYRFRALPARLQGLEIEARTRLIERPWTLDLDTSLDSVRGRQRDSGEPLPRLAPLRATLGLVAMQGDWRGGAQLQHAAAQRRFSAGDIATPGYTLVNLWAGWLQRSRFGEALWTIKLDNAFDRLAYNASALRTARELSPLGGRALSAAVRFTL